MSKMQCSIFMLILMGQCFLLMCHGYHYEYHFIPEKMTWEKAQNYCRTCYTDLAKVFDETDIQRLLQKTGQGTGTGAWIGLRSLFHPGKDNRMWHWSQPGMEYSGSNGNFDHPPNAIENCAVLKENKVLEDFPCNCTFQFVCYDENNSDKKFHVIQKEKTWSQAQNYCRNHHTDLISGDQQIDEFKKESNSMTLNLWIGLFRDAWRWSDQSSFSFRYWDSEQFEDEQNAKCAFISNNKGKWSNDNCNETKPFFCYEEKLVLVKDLEKTWEGALDYCRHHHMDLVTITNPNEQGWVQEKAKEASSEWVWLGLRYTCSLDLWFWVSDRLVCYDNWAPGEVERKCYMAAAMSKKDPHEWVNKSDTNIFNFICVKR